MPDRRLIVAAAAADRLAAARRFVAASLAAAPEVLILAPTRGAADDLLRAACPERGGLFGVHRMTLDQLAAELATRALARRRLTPVTALGAEALAARTIALAEAAGELDYFAPVAATPGMARALAATIGELRLAGLGAGALEAAGAPGRDLARLAARYADELERLALADRAVVYELARWASEAGAHQLLGLPLLLLDVAPRSAAERVLLATLARRAPAVLATAVGGDRAGRRTLEDVLGVAAEDADDAAPPRTQLDRLRRRVFAAAGPDAAAPAEDPDFVLLSAPGEGRECVEIARRIRALATGDGTAKLGFDRVAILLRHPQDYMPLVEEALRRARIPAYYTRGTIRPHPAGRAFLALLDCAAEGLSATRFAEYLSLGQVPRLDRAGAPPAVEVPWVVPESEQMVFKSLVAPSSELARAGAAEAAETEAGDLDDGGDDAPAVAGTLRVPRGWEKLLVDARVYGGRERWRARLAGLRAEIRLQLRALGGEEPAREHHLEHRLELLEHLERFALPVVDALAALPATADWGEWLRALERLAAQVLRQPEGVLAVLAELRPMDRVAEVGLDEVRRVLGERLTALREEPPQRRYGRVFVATIPEALGRSFDAVFLPGLAEGVFPRRTFEDPLLLDDARRLLDDALPTQEARIADERLLLRIAAGAARAKLIVSYPNLDVLEGRPRVPSFYALDLLRAAVGELPDLRRLETRAAAGSGSRLGWPAPRDPAAALDEAEYDLAVLEPLLRRRVPGAGRFLITANPRLARSLRRRYRRWRPGFSSADGVVDPDEATLAKLAERGPRRAAYSPTALQLYASCPYRFLLYAVFGLRPREEAVRLERLDPLTRGSLFHQVQFELYQALEARDLLDFEAADEHAVLTLLDEVFDRVAERYRDDLAPAIGRVWRSEIEGLRTDLRGWVRYLTASDEPWRPRHFELGFGTSRRARDRRPPLAQAELAGGRLLRGAIDLVEVDPERDLLRVTDHKTGRAPRARRLVVGGGKTLQPILYALAAERLLERPVASGRLFYCTRRGGYETVEVALDDGARAAAARVLEEIDGALERGFLPAAPEARACGWCDYRLVCGSNEETRIGRKHPQRLVTLGRLRAEP